MQDLKHDMTIKRQQNSFWFQSLQQYIISFFYIDGYMFQSVDHPQVKTQNKVTCSANNVHVIWGPIQLTIY